MLVLRLGAGLLQLLHSVYMSPASGVEKILRFSCKSHMGPLHFAGITYWLFWGFSPFSAPLDATLIVPSPSCRNVKTVQVF